MGNRHRSYSPPPPPPIPNSSPSYIMNQNELIFYQQNYPDLSGMNNSQLQTHWSTIGANQQRSNQGPSQQQSSSDYKYKGCYNDTGNRAISHYNKNVSSIDECAQLAMNQQPQASVFGLQNNGECFTSNDLNKTYDMYGIHFKPCGKMGSAWNNQVYELKKIIPLNQPSPILNISNFSTKEPFSNIEINNKNYIKFIIVTLFIFIIIFALFFRKKPPC